MIGICGQDHVLERTDEPIITGTTTSVGYSKNDEAKSMNVQAAHNFPPAAAPAASRAAGTHLDRDGDTDNSTAASDAAEAARKAAAAASGVGRNLNVKG